MDEWETEVESAIWKRRRWGAGRGDKESETEEVKDRMNELIR